MKKKINYLIIASDGWPLEQIKGHPIINFFRRLIHGRYKVCRDCWYSNQSKKNVGTIGLDLSPLAVNQSDESSK